MAAENLQLRMLELTVHEIIILRLFQKSSSNSLLKSNDETLTNIIESIHSLIKLLRLCYHSQAFYKLAASPGLNKHWQKLLERYQEEEDFNNPPYALEEYKPLDQLLSTICHNLAEEVKHEGQDELSDTFDKIAQQWHEKYQPEIGENNHKLPINIISP